jgi:RsiW-degrading membrane proteinase PrsW (M82 family)
MMMLMIGVFSGLGFAACENILYAEKSTIFGLLHVDSIIGSILSAQNEEEHNLALEVGAHGIVEYTLVVMTAVLLRAVSCVFVHSIWTGIFAYYLACAMMIRKQWAVFCCLGLTIPMVLHGFYDWLLSLHPVYAIFVVGFSFVLFYIYLQKLRKYTGEQASTRDHDGKSD